MDTVQTYEFLIRSKDERHWMVDKHAKEISRIYLRNTKLRGQYILAKFVRERRLYFSILWFGYDNT